MFKIHEIREIIKLIDQSSLNEFEVKTEECRIYLKRGGDVTIVQPQATVSAPVSAAAPAAPAPTPVVEAQPAIAAAQAAPALQAAPAAAPTPKADENLHQIVSPMVGTFYRQPEVGAAPYVKPGDQVQTSTVVCIVEAMKLFNEIEAEVSGEIVEVLVENGQLVEYGQPLFTVRKA